MNDAYTIGLTLALDDGVSAGIDKIRRELSVLDKAIVASTANLLRLQEAARTAVSAGVSEAAAVAAAARKSAAVATREAAKPSPMAVEPAAETAIAPAAPRADEDIVPVAAPLPRKPPTQVVAGGSTAPVSLPRAAPEPPIVAPPSRVDVASAPISLGGQRASQADASVVAAPLPKAPPPVTRQAQAATVGGPPLLVQLPAIVAAKPDALPKVPMPPAPSVKLIEQTAPSPAPGSKPATIPPTAPVNVTPVNTTPPAPKMTERQAAPLVRVDAALPAPMAAPVMRETSSVPSAAPPGRAAPMAPSMETSRRRSPHEPAGAAAPRQTGERHHERSMGGTIVVDSLELGRWMAEHLAHVASRPPGGGVAFDPRMAPVWAGAPISA